MIYDLVIVGAGPCGLSAAINSTLKKIIVFDKKSGGGLMKSEENEIVNVKWSTYKSYFLNTG